jgi:regulator of cell morphogenesis and NO signaling
MLDANSIYAEIENLPQNNGSSIDFKAGLWIFWQIM